jgi:hypothetical protein
VTGEAFMELAARVDKAVAERNSALPPTAKVQVKKH